jgi:hypothetical protein
MSGVGSDIHGDDLGIGEVGEEFGKGRGELGAFEAAVLEHDGNPAFGAPVDACYVGHLITVARSCSLPVGGTHPA